MLTTSSLRRFGATLVAGALLASSQAALAHRTYNVTGFTGTLDPLFTLSGQDGLGLPLPQYAGGSGPNANTAGGSFYKGALPVSWMTALHAATNEAGEVFNLSTADALSVGASTPANFVLGAGGNTFGTGLDFGYVRVDNPQGGNGHGVKVTVSTDATLGSSLLPYVALYAGWDHSWEGATGATKQVPGGGSTANRVGVYTAGDDPLGSDLKLVSEVRNEAGLNSVSLFFSTVQPSSHFTLFIGGVNGTAGAYRAVVETVQTVPVPAAAWLLGSALMALTLRRRSPV